MKRLEKLRLVALEGNCHSDEFFYLFFKYYSKCEATSEKERYAKAYDFAFSNLTPAISEGELIVGNRNTKLKEEELKEWHEIYKPMAESFYSAGGQDSHMAIDYEMLLNRGINGIIDKINGYLNDCKEEKKEFYNLCKLCLEAVIKHSESYAAKALELSLETQDPLRKKELQIIAEICKKVPANPAQSFYEAVQSVHFVTHCLSLNPHRFWSQQFQLGRPDQYLLPYYEKDINNGSLTPEYAQLLLDCLGTQINMRVPHGLSSGYMVGGKDNQGQTVANDLTEMLMQVIDDIRLVYPSVGFCHTENMPPKYLDKACKLILKGYSHPAIFNDDIISKGLIYYGVPENESHNYIHSTCVEITPIASSNVWVASPYTNMVQLLLDCMDREYDNFEALTSAFFSALDKRIKENFENQNYCRKMRSEKTFNPLLSCFVHDCLEKGLDIEQGGAKYNWIMPSFVGVANLVDSLYAIRSLVFMEKSLSIMQFKKILENDYDTQEELRLKILKTIPKYGNDIDEIDKFFYLITEHIVKECEKYTCMHSNGRLIPSVFCWIRHESFGRETSASPDGRKSGFPLGDGSGPCQGREFKGPTASILSSTKWDHSKFIGGVAVNLKFAKMTLGNNSAKALEAIILTYLKRGGFELQINVVDNETLKKAQLNPELYKDLVVRVGGYSDYFIKLSPQMQEEIILRTEHSI